MCITLNNYYTQNCWHNSSEALCSVFHTEARLTWRGSLRSSTVGEGEGHTPLASRTIRPAPPRSMISTTSFILYRSDTLTDLWYLTDRWIEKLKWGETHKNEEQQCLGLNTSGKQHRQHNKKTTVCLLLSNWILMSCQHEDRHTLSKANTHFKTPLKGETTPISYQVVPDKILAKTRLSRGWSEKRPVPNSTLSSTEWFCVKDTTSKGSSLGHMHRWVTPDLKRGGANAHFSYRKLGAAVGQKTFRSTAIETDYR